MIELYHTNRILENQFFSISEKDFPDSAPAIHGLAAAALVTKEIREFEKLLEVSLTFLLMEHDLFAVLVERFPEYKSRLRSYRGFLYGLKDELGEEDYFEREFDLPEKQSLFGAIIRLKTENLTSVLDLLTTTDFVFGLVAKKGRDHEFSEFPAFLQEVFSRLVPVEKVIWVDWFRGVLLFANPNTCLFRTAHDGRDNLRLEFYGREQPLNLMWENLLAHLQQNFYLRRRQPWMDGAEGAVGG